VESSVELRQLRYFVAVAVALTTGSGAAALRELEPHSNGRRASLVALAALVLLALGAVRTRGLSNPASASAA
jgi:hypothetical protein